MMADMDTDGLKIALEDISELTALAVSKFEGMEMPPEILERVIDATTDSYLLGQKSLLTAAETELVLWILSWWGASAPDKDPRKEDCVRIVDKLGGSALVIA